MTIQVKQITKRSEIQPFVRFPMELYKGSEYWVPPLVSLEVQTLDPMRNPAMASTSTALFLALSGRTVDGRIAASACTVNVVVEGRFGWFDVIDDREVSELLFEAAALWITEHGGRDIRGPMGFTNLDKAGMLIEGFEEMPTISTIYNAPYYNDHLASLGFRKAIDYIEHEFAVPAEIPERVTEFARLIGEKSGLRVTNEKNAVKKYGGAILELINETHKDLYGFVPISESVKRFYINRYLPFFNPDFVALVLDTENKLVGYGLTMPSMTRAFQKAGGRLFPFGFIQISRALKQVNRADMVMIGIAEQYRNKGVTALIFQHLLNTYHKYEVRYVESNPELENNHQLLALWGDYPDRIHKRRRIYHKSL
jgi:hypothetical protein